jgi:hypothetical protein
VAIACGLGCALLGLAGRWIFGRLGLPNLGLVPLVPGLLAGLLVASWHRDRVAPSENLQWSWRTARRRVRSALAIGLFLGIGLGVLGVRFGGSSEWAVGAVFALVFGLGGVLFGLGVVGLTTGESTSQGSPNEGMRRSAQSALTSALIFCLLGGLGSIPFTALAFWVITWIQHGVHNPRGALAIGLVLGLMYGLPVVLFAALVVGLAKGGLACLQHLVLRWLLWRSDCAPWRYAAFLDYATERIFLRKVGGGYIFVHRLLQDHFAELWEREYSGAE